MQLRRTNVSVDNPTGPLVSLSRKKLAILPFFLTRVALLRVTLVPVCVSIADL